MKIRTALLLPALALPLLQGCPAPVYQMNQVPASAPLAQAMPIAKR